MTGSDITLTFLGTGASIPPVGRQQVSFTLKHPHGLILFDCGEGTQYLIRKHKISIRKEFIICISHIHSDHFLGIPGLLASLQLLNRTEVVKIVGPVGTQSLISNLISANFVAHTFKIEVIELTSGQVHNGKNYDLIAVSAIHNENALSYIWEEHERTGKIRLDKLEEIGISPGPIVGDLQNNKQVVFDGKIIYPNDVKLPNRRGRMVVYSGDTYPNLDLVEKIKNKCDVLVHEATYPNNMTDLAKERGHSTIKQALEIAKSALAETLILTHFSQRILNLDEEVDEVKEIFPNVKSSYEGMKFVIPYSE